MKRLPAPDTAAAWINAAADLARDNPAAAFLFLVLATAAFAACAARSI